MRQMESRQKQSRTQRLSIDIIIFVVNILLLVLCNSLPSLDNALASLVCYLTVALISLTFHVENQLDVAVVVVTSYQLSHHGGTRN